MDHIRYAIIGLGNIGTRHLEKIMHNDESRLVALCDIDDKKANIALDHHIPFYDNIGDLLNRADIDVVSICTPNYLHSVHCVQVLDAGKHAIVEKPMALSVAECDMMIAKEIASDKKIFAVKQNRYNPPVVSVKDAIKKGLLGDIFSVQVNCFWNRNERYYAHSEWRGKKALDGGCLFTQFSHFVDILYYLIGDVSVYGGTVDNFTHPNIEIEDTGTFIMRCKDHNAIINFNYTTSTYVKNLEGSITILGTKGSVKIGGQYLNTIEYQFIENLNLDYERSVTKANDYGTYQGSMSNHHLVIENVNDVLLRGKPMTTTAEDGRAVVSIIERMYQACKG